MSTVLDRRAARAAQHTAALAAAAAPQRLDLYAPIHKALRHLMMDTLLRVGRLDVADADELNATLGQLDELLSFCAAHVAHENDFVHAAIEARRPGAAARTADDHVEHLDAIEALRVKAEGLRAAPADAAAISALRLYRHLALFVAENFQHMHVEETANNAALWAHYRDDELVALHERLLASIPPAEHLRTARWMVSARRVALPAIAPVALRSDTAAVERGRYLYASRGCADCHGQDGTGKDVIKDDGLWVRAPNITAGPGGVVGRYAPVDWVRTLRHGVKPDGRAVLIMPSEDYARLTDDDLAGIVAYVRQLPAAPGEPARLELPLPLRIAYAVGALRDASEKIDHSLPPARAGPEGVTAEHGAYVANACIGCHGPRLSGGKIPGAPPQWPAAANLTPAADGGLARYGSTETFQAMFRTGRRPDGTPVSPVMPFQALGAMSDTDVQALYLYLKGLPARPAGG